MLKVSVDTRDADRMLARLALDQRAPAISAALNKVAAKARTEMVRGITSEFAVMGKDVRERVELQRARRGQLMAALEAFGVRKGKRSRNVILFTAKPARGGVTVKIRKQGGRKLIRNAFIGNKGRTVFSREGKARLPIAPVETIDLPQMFNTRRINERVVRRINAELPVEIERAIAMVLRK